MHITTKTIYRVPDNKDDILDCIAEALTLAKEWYTTVSFIYCKVAFIVTEHSLASNLYNAYTKIKIHDTIQ
jgi:hypothetical protein